MVGKFTIFFYILVFSVTSCSVPKQIQLSIPESLDNIDGKKKCKLTFMDYASKRSSAYAIPERKIKLHFYIIDNKEGTNNFTEDDITCKYLTDKQWPMLQYYLYFLFFNGNPLFFFIVTAESEIFNLT